MSDNTIINSGSGGDTIATDDIGGVKHTRVKITLGADGTSDGDVASGNPMPVSVSGVVSANITGDSVARFPTNLTNTGTFNGSTSAVALAIEGRQGAGAYIAADGGWIGYLVSELSYDGGISWAPCYFWINGTSTRSSTITVTAGQTLLGNFVGIAGATHVRLNASGRANGSITVYVNASAGLPVDPVGIQAINLVDSSNTSSIANVGDYANNAIRTNELKTNTATTTATFNGGTPYATLAVEGRQGVGAFIVPDGSWSGYLVSELSYDGGSTWAPCYFWTNNTMLRSSSIAVTAGTNINGNFVGIAGATHVRLNAVNRYGGSATVYLNASSGIPEEIGVRPIGALDSSNGASTNVGDSANSAIRVSIVGSNTVNIGNNVSITGSPNVTSQIIDHAGANSGNPFSNIGDFGNNSIRVTTVAGTGISASFSVTDYAGGNSGAPFTNIADYSNAAIRTKIVGTPDVNVSGGSINVASGSVSINGAVNTTCYVGDYVTSSLYFSFLESVNKAIRVNQTPISANTNWATNATNSNATITYGPAGSGISNIISGLAWSYSTAPTAGRLTITDNGGTIFDIDITSAGAGFIDFNPPIASTTNASLVITLYDGGSGCVGKLNIKGARIMNL